jgi:hypothetical protein
VAGMAPLTEEQARILCANCRHPRAYHNNGLKCLRTDEVGVSLAHTFITRCACTTFQGPRVKALVAPDNTDVILPPNIGQPKSHSPWDYTDDN